jgi:hypothetical protein
MYASGTSIETSSIVFFFKDDLRLRNLNFKSFAPHFFDEDGEVEFAAAGDNPRVARLSRRDF